MKKLFQVAVAAMVIAGLAASMAPVHAVNAAGRSCWSNTYSEWVADGDTRTTSTDHWLCKDGQWVRQREGNNDGAEDTLDPYYGDAYVAWYYYNGRTGYHVWYKSNPNARWMKSTRYDNGYWLGYDSFGQRRWWNESCNCMPPG